MQIDSYGRCNVGRRRKHRGAHRRKPDTSEDIRYAAHAEEEHVPAARDELWMLTFVFEEVGSSIPSLTHLHDEVSFGKMLNPECPPAPPP
ncbi:unnamed protein product [Pleuronectes platessa]|uniref:Uncharacterized protein n=1 Tax=Pleuronectes platessa TaxID=8262 RepID=A0A9N7YD87_PLEPL|nr:unnamed protein product [Pleuronectes platessa]